MSLINYTNREINIKIVYYGPGLSGKTTNLQYIHQKLNPKQRGKLLSLATETDRTLFFDFLPINLGNIKGFSTRFHVYTVPGQVHYDETRRMVLNGVDGIVFVADSQLQMMEDNLESLRNLYANLAAMGRDLKDLPFVLQYNKRDLENVVPIQELHRALNNLNVPAHDAVALSGKGVLQTFTEISKLALKKVREMPTLLNEERAEENELLTKFMHGEGTEEVHRVVKAPESAAVSAEGLLAPHERMLTPSEKEHEDLAVTTKDAAEELTSETEEGGMEPTNDADVTGASEAKDAAEPLEMPTSSETLSEENEKDGLMGETAETVGFMDAPLESTLSEPPRAEESGADVESNLPDPFEAEPEDRVALAEAMKLADEVSLEEIVGEEAAPSPVVLKAEAFLAVSEDLAYDISEEELPEEGALFGSQGHPEEDFLVDTKEIMEEGAEYVEESSDEEAVPYLAEQSGVEQALERDKDWDQAGPGEGEEEPGLMDERLSDEGPSDEMEVVTEGFIDHLTEDAEALALNEQSPDREPDVSEGCAGISEAAALENEEAAFLQETKEVETTQTSSVIPEEIKSVTLGAPESMGGGRFLIPLVIDGGSRISEYKIRLFVDAEDITADKIDASIVTDPTSDAPGTGAGVTPLFNESSADARADASVSLSEETDLNEPIDASFLDELDEFDDAHSDELLPEEEIVGEELEDKKKKKGFLVSLFGSRHAAKH